MGYITRNANIILLFLILLSATALVGATVYFQQRFTSINTEYNTKLSQLSNITTQLEEYQGILTKAREELALKGSREEELTGKFTDIKTEKETLSQERDRLLQEKTSLNVALADKTSRLTSATNTIAEKEAAITNLNKEITANKAEIRDLEADISDYDDLVDCLRDTADASEATC